MHDAFEFTPIIRNVPLRISCITSYEDQLLVGTTAGMLLVFQVNDESQRSMNAFRLVDTKKHFSKKPIESLEVVKELDLLLSLSDQIISIHDLKTFEFKMVLRKTKYATAMAVHRCIEHVPLSRKNVRVNLSSQAAASPKPSRPLDIIAAGQPKSSIASSRRTSSVRSVPSSVGDQESVEASFVVPSFVASMSKRSSSHSMEEVKPSGAISLFASSLPRSLSDFFTGPTRPRTDSGGGGEDEKSSVTGFEEDTIPSMVTRLAVLVKKKIILFTWIDSEFHDVREMPLPGRVNALAWAGDRQLCVALSHVYAIIDIDTAVTKELFAYKRSSKSDRTTASGNRALITPLPNREELLLLKETTSIFIHYSGMPSQKFGIRWSTEPSSLVCHFPYLIAALPDTPSGASVHIQLLSSGVMVQKLNLESVRFATTSLGGRGALFVASEKMIWALHPVAISKQIEQLIEAKEFEAALELLQQVDSVTPDDKNAQIRMIKVVYALSAFVERFEFEKAFGLFYEASADPPIVIRTLFPSLMSEDLRKKLNLAPTLSPGLLLPQTTQSCDLSGHVSRILLTSEKLEGARLVEALTALAKYLTDVKNKLNRERNKLNQKSQQSPPSSPLVDFDSNLAGIDTLLLQVHLMTNDSLVGPLLRSPNNCLVDEVERLLLEHKRWKDLVDLYFSKGLHRKALLLLTKHLRSSHHDLSGSEVMVQYLEKLGKEHIELILEFSIPILKQDEAKGLQIFLRDSNQAAPLSLPQDIVLSHLEKNAKNAVLPYVEHMVLNEADENVEFHDRLILAYLEHVKVEKSIDPWRFKLIHILRTSKYYRPERILPHFPPNSLLEERAIVLGKLGQHSRVLWLATHRLRSLQQAEEYCDSVWRADDSSSIYNLLMKVLLTPNEILSELPAADRESSSETIEPMFSEAVDVLSRFGERFDAPTVLNMMPREIPIHQLQRYLTRVLETRSKDQHQFFIARNLLRAIQVQMKLGLCEKRRRKVVIQDKTVCKVCAKRIGAGNAFIFVDGKGRGQGAVVHLGCRDRFLVQ